MNSADFVFRKLTDEFRSNLVISMNETLSPEGISRRYSFHDPVEEGYYVEVQTIKQKANDILQKIADFERDHPAYHKEIGRFDDIDDNEAFDVFDGKKSFTITPRSFESYREEELDLRAKLKKLNRKNRKLRERVADMERMVSESISKEKELRQQLDISYQRRIFLEKKGVVIV